MKQCFASNVFGNTPKMCGKKFSESSMHMQRYISVCCTYQNVGEEASQTTCEQDFELPALARLSKTSQSTTCRFFWMGKLVLNWDM